MAVITAEASTEPGWMTTFNAQKSQLLLGGWDMLFIGDSITQHWLTAGRGLDVWNTFYAPRAALNLGIGGDEAQNLLWRLNHYTYTNAAPRLAVVMIGTNNVQQDEPPVDISDTIGACIDKLKAELPSMQILLMSLLAREDKPYKIRRIRAAEVSGRAAVNMNKTNVGYYNVAPALLQPNGLFLPGVMITGDVVHPATPGYQIWADAIEPTVASIIV